MGQAFPRQEGGLKALADHCGPCGYWSSRRKNNLCSLHLGTCYLTWHVRRKGGHLLGPWVVQTQDSGNQVQGGPQ